MLRTLTEQEWVAEYVKKKKNPLPVVLGTRGTWSSNRKPMIILIGFTIEDVMVLGDIYGVSHHPVREMKDQRVTYYAINVIDKKKVKKIIEEWKAEPLHVIS
ncbi:hypothetical protein WQ54_23795 [Bacillus sp. SA1-12]|uniref:hypothetical protein n=1 Tax=Bacillus sp. SA1-12 TaxID=1455638 RepID=UPI000626FDF3|nr:hypothetical protein [Bacillus sp. SA1-12]KKI90127.1 hypothetical protein WQ54_23795 [Bacillus sp. SA1-12]